MEILNEIIYVVKNLRLAPPAYKYGLVVYFIISLLIVVFAFRKLSRSKNKYLSIFYRSSIFSILFSPTILVGGGAAAAMPASFAIVASIYFGWWQAFVWAIVPIGVVLGLMFSIWAVFLSLSQDAKNT
jgi:hypothetical protein